jgi:transposase InsO family protein
MPTNVDVSQVIKKVEEIVDASDKDNVRLLQRANTDLQSKLRSLRQFKFKDEEELIRRFPYEGLEEEDGVYMWQGYCILSLDQVPALLEAEFKTLPPSVGRARFVSHLRQRYVGVSNATVSLFLKDNDLHQIFTQRRKSSRAVTTTSSSPFDTIVADITFLNQVGPVKYLLVMCDMWSKFIWCKLISQLGKPCAAAIEEIIVSMPGKVKNLRTDNGAGDFKNQYMTDMAKRLGVKQIFSQVATPTSNGLAERTVATVKTAVYSLMHEKKDLATLTDAVEKSVRTLNTTVSSAHGHVPSQLNKPIEQLPPAVVAEVRKRLEANSEQRAPNAKYHKLLQSGNRVRIAVEQLDNNIAQKIKNKQWKPSMNQTYSSKVYTVKSQNALNRVAIEGFNFTIPRGGVLLVNDDAKDLTKIVEAAPQPVLQKGKKRMQQTDFVLPTRKLRSGTAANG